MITAHYTGTWNQPAWKRDAQKEYLDKHIEGSVRFDISDISDKKSSAPLMLPPPEQFEEQVGKVECVLCRFVILHLEPKVFMGLSHRC